MRTQNAIVARVLSLRDHDVFGHRLEVLIDRLDYAHAKQFLTDCGEVNAVEWNVLLAKQRGVKSEAIDYLEFAWGKARNHRGLSALRSVEKLTEWAWLLRDDALVAAISAAGFAQYGAPKLAVISRALGAPMPDDVATLRMIAGEKCRPDCDEGCGQ